MCMHVYVSVCVFVCNDSCSMGGGGTQGYCITFSALISVPLQLPGKKKKEKSAAPSAVESVPLINRSSSVSHINTNG